MLIDFEFSGGFANLRFKYNVDTDTLPPQLAEELLRLVDDSGVFSIQPGEVAPGSHGPPDVLSYRLSLSGSGGTQSLVMNDVTVPVRLRPLLTFLQKLAIEQKQKS
jgi:hypothetical protein